jgi:polyketide cyclase/dehydrase/lipid transport protein
VADLAVELSGRIEAPPEFVWSKLVDPDGSSEWLEDVEEVAVDGFERRSWRSGERWVEGRLVELTPQRRLSVRLDAPMPLLREAQLSIELTGEERGTRFTLALDGAPSGLGRVLRPWLRLRTEIALHRAVRSFRSATEEALAACRKRSAARPARRAPLAALVAASDSTRDPQRFTGA